MKKSILVIVNLLLVLSLVLSALPMAAFAAEEETEYTRMKAIADDPYGTFKFSSKGKNQTIDPDTVLYAVVRYRADASVLDTNGNMPIGQIFTYVPAEPFIAVEYEVFDGQWHNCFVDLTKVPSSAGDAESNWTSSKYSNPDLIRFDPLSGNRMLDAEQEKPKSKIVGGSSIDIAWIAFFENEADAKAYTGKEDTPYCLLDNESFSKLQGANNLKCELFEAGQSTSDNTIEDYVISINAGTTPVQMNGHELAIKTIEVPEGKVMRTFSLLACPTWSNQEDNSDAIAEVYVWKGDYDSSYAGKPIASCELTGHLDNGPMIFKFNNELRYGHEYLIVIYPTNDGTLGYWAATPVSDTSLEGWSFFWDDEEVDTEVDNYPPVGYGLVEVGDLGPEPTEAPTAEPTATPTAAPTEAPTAAPTEAPAATDAPAAATDAPEATKAPAKSGCGSVIFSGAAVIAVLGAAIVLKKKH